MAEKYLLRNSIFKNVKKFILKLICIVSTYLAGNFSFPEVSDLTPPKKIVKNLFPPIGKSCRGNHDLLYQNSIRKFVDDLEHQVIDIWYDICNFFKCDILHFCE